MFLSMCTFAIHYLFHFPTNPYSSGTVSIQRKQGAGLKAGALHYLQINCSFLYAYFELFVFISSSYVMCL